jgi:sulfur-carrier protein
VVQVVVPTMLAAQAEGRRSFDVDAKTTGDALRALPVADLLFNERGELNRHLNVYVDGLDHRECGGLGGPLTGAHEIRVVAMVSGG